MNHRMTHGFAADNGLAQGIEGMEVQFDEKVTLFPVEVQEIREDAPVRRLPRRPEPHALSGPAGKRRP